MNARKPLRGEPTTLFSFGRTNLPTIFLPWTIFRAGRPPHRRDTFFFLFKSDFLRRTKPNEATGTTESRRGTRTRARENAPRSAMFVRGLTSVVSFSIFLFSDRVFSGLFIDYQFTAYLVSVSFHDLDVRSSIGPFGERETR